MLLLCFEPVFMGVLDLTDQWAKATGNVPVSMTCQFWLSQCKTINKRIERATMAD
jgi:hypothetical protein